MTRWVVACNFRRYVGVGRLEAQHQWLRFLDFVGVEKEENAHIFVRFFMQLKCAYFFILFFFYAAFNFFLAKTGSR